MKNNNPNLKSAIAFVLIVMAIAIIAVSTQNQNLNQKEMFAPDNVNRNAAPPSVSITDTAGTPKNSDYSGPVLSATKRDFSNLINSNSNLKKGSSSTEEIRNLQRFLWDNGYYSGNIEGQFGDETESAVIRFQRVNNLKEDGIVGKDTRLAIKNTLENPRIRDTVPSKPSEPAAESLTQTEIDLMSKLNLIPSSDRSYFVSLNQEDNNHYLINSDGSVTALSIDGSSGYLPPGGNPNNPDEWTYYTTGSGAPAQTTPIQQTPTRTSVTDSQLTDAQINTMNRLGLTYKNSDGTYSSQNLNDNKHYLVNSDGSVTAFNVDGSSQYLPPGRDPTNALDWEYNSAPYVATEAEMQAEWAKVQKDPKNPFKDYNEFKKYYYDLYTTPAKSQEDIKIDINKFNNKYTFRYNNELKFFDTEQDAKKELSRLLEADGKYAAAAKYARDTGDYSRSAQLWSRAGNHQNSLDDYKKAMSMIIKDPNMREDLKEQEVNRLAEEANKEIDANNNLKDDEKEKQKNIVKNYQYNAAQYPGWFGGIAKMLDGIFGWTEKYDLTGYPNLANLFWQREDAWTGKIYDTFSNWLSGPDGIAAELCKIDIEDDITGSGFAMSQSVSGAYAHIEGEKITVVNMTNSSGPTNLYFYKVSFEVNPGGDATGCGIKFKTYLGRGTTPLIVYNTSNTVYQFSLDRGDSPISYSGTNLIVKPSKNVYDKVCIYFDEISPRAGQTCLIGIDEGDYLCNNIVDGAQKEFTNFKCDWCDNFVAAITTFGGAGSGGGTRTGSSSTTSGTSTTPSSGTARSGPAVNPNI